MMAEETPKDIAEFQETVRKRQTGRNRKYYYIAGAAVLVLAAVAVYLLTRPGLVDQIAIPYIAHQKPAVDPHLPNANALADKLDEVVFDGLFNVSANPSGVVYEDGLGEFLDIDAQNIVRIRLKTGVHWHDSYAVTRDGDEINIAQARQHLFAARDLAFTLRRIQALGSLSPDWILVSQALDPVAFEGPDQDNVIRFRFKSDRIWTQADIKEVLSFKILPDDSPLNALNYTVGTASYLSLPPDEGSAEYYKTPGSQASISRVLLSPFIDNSTYTTEFSSGNINVLLETPFGSLSPILGDSTESFAKSNISTTFFAVLFNTQRLTREQRVEMRKLLNSTLIADRFFKVGTEQQRHIVDYKGNRDNYADYINRSVFPSSSYYVDEEIVVPGSDSTGLNLSLLPDTVQIRACMNYGFREEYADMITILNDPSVTRGRVRALAVGNDDIIQGKYDALLIAISGYRSNFLFDLYDIFMREPNLATYTIALTAGTDETGGPVALHASFQSEKNFFRLDATREGPELADIQTLLQYVHGFMSTRFIGDKQEYARRVSEL
ncbi:MAG: hypothetical protein IT282_03825, partial [Bacteroidetes bacterium]|nr:hypothetical protein [Bacteroidota bacterium]